jgi:hypothetical protein
MRRKNKASGFAQHHVLFVVVAVCLTASLVLNLVNFWFNSPLLTKLSVIFGAIPVILIIVGLVLFFTIRPLIDRRIVEEMKKEQKTDRSDQ